MARQPISEFRAKTILYGALGQPYTGLSLDAETAWKENLPDLPPTTGYVVKVDEGVKGRFKKGLVALDVAPGEVAVAVRRLMDKGYRFILVEPHVAHTPTDERYLMINRTRVGNLIMYNPHGGVDVEARADAMQQHIHRPSSERSVEQSLGLAAGVLAKLADTFDANHFSFLELNPIVVLNGNLHFLDAAVEVDGEAASLVAGRWTADDVRGQRRRTPEEQAVSQLAARSQSSFNLQVLNPNGRVFLLLSGGGASVTIADEVHNQGFGRDLANYGEYSGNPTTDETYLYTKQILSLLLKSSARSKVLIIGGGVANFTDIRKTFAGVIRALQDVQDQLAAAGVKVFVRRGGPYEVDGLAAMQAYLASSGLLGIVAGPDMLLSEIIPLALKSLKERGV
jgi:succinyl-CoA synthetase beta subunit